MSEKKTSTPKEIPLHEVVLKIMYEANKERPAELTITEVYQKISDSAISEINVSDVLNWLVAQKQVERVSGKYSLDRYAFLDQRAIDRGTNKQKKSKEEEEIPLHEIILNLMYESNKEEPAKLTLDDVFWKVSDPKVQKSLVGDVLKWLLNQRRVEYLSGKYSLDRIEFQDQRKASEKRVAKKKADERAKAKKEKVSEAKPKIVIPPSTEEVKDPPKPKKKVQPKEKIERSSPRPAVQKVTKVDKEKVAEPAVETASSIKESAHPKWRLPLLVATVVCVIYTFYLLFVLNASMSIANNSLSSEKIKSELVSAKAKLNETSGNQSLSENDIAFLKEKIASLEELTSNKAISAAKNDANDRSNSLLTRLTLTLCLSFLLLFFLLFGANSKRISPKA